MGRVGNDDRVETQLAFRGISRVDCEEIHGWPKKEREKRGYFPQMQILYYKKNAFDASKYREGILLNMLH